MPFRSGLCVRRRIAVHGRCDGPACFEICSCGRSGLCTRQLSQHAFCEGVMGKEKGDLPGSVSAAIIFILEILGEPPLILRLIPLPLLWFPDGVSSMLISSSLSSCSGLSSEAEVCFGNAEEDAKPRDRLLCASTILFLSESGGGVHERAIADA